MLALAASGPAVSLQQIICAHYRMLQSFAGGTTLVLLAAGFTVAIVGSGPVRTVGLAAIIVMGLAITSFDTILGSLGAGGGCPAGPGVYRPPAA